MTRFAPPLFSEGIFSPFPGQENFPPSPPTRNCTINKKSRESSTARKSRVFASLHISSVSSESFSPRSMALDFGLGLRMSDDPFEAFESFMKISGKRRKSQEEKAPAEEKSPRPAKFAKISPTPAPKRRSFSAPSDPPRASKRTRFSSGVSTSPPPPEPQRPPQPSVRASRRFPSLKDRLSELFASRFAERCQASQARRENATSHHRAAQKTREFSATPKTPARTTSAAPAMNTRSSSKTLNDRLSALRDLEDFNSLVQRLRERLRPAVEGEIIRKTNRKTNMQIIREFAPELLESHQPGEPLKKILRRAMAIFHPDKSPLLDSSQQQENLEGKIQQHLKRECIFQIFRKQYEEC